MRPTRLRSLLGFGLLGVVAFASVATAGPLPLPGIPKPSNPMPAGPVIPMNVGLKTTATLSPRDLFDAEVAMDVLSPARIEASKNRVLMTKYTQLFMQFKAAANKGYRVDCKFTGNPSMHIMEFANGSIVRQSSSNPSAGTLNHTILSTTAVRDIKLFFQATSDTDWSQCVVAPV